MTSTALPVKVSSPTAPPNDSYRAAIEAFGEVAEALRGHSELDQLLHVISRKICELVGVERCSVYMHDREAGVYRGQVGHPNPKANDPLMKRLVCGVPGDRFTQQIVETKAPLAIRDAQRDPRTVRSAMRDWGVRSMLGVPMVLRDEVIGLIFLDTREELHPFSPLDEELSSAFAGLAAVAVSQCELIAELSASHDTMARQNQALRKVAAVDDRFTKLVVSGGSLPEVAAAVTELTDKPCAIFDTEMLCLAAAGDDCPAVPGTRHLLTEPEVAAAIAAVEPQSPAVIGPFRRLGLAERMLICPVTVRDSRIATLVLFARGSGLRSGDALIGRRVAGIVALEINAERRAAAAEWNARSALAAQLLRGSHDMPSVERRANYLGVRLEHPHVVCLFGARDSEELELPDPETISRSLAERASDLTILATGAVEGVALIAEVPAASTLHESIDLLREMVAEVCVELDPDRRLAVGLSRSCRGVDDFLRGYDQARQVFNCMSLTSEVALGADDLGPGRLFLAAASTEEALRYADDALGSLTEPDAPPELLETLVAYFDEARSIRRSAVRLNVHENTVRHRLTRIEEATGLEVSLESDDQLTAQIALLVLHLRKELPTA